jgi:hypothetical protein
MTYTDTGLTNGLTYYYAIQAFNDIGNGSFSELISGTPIGVPWAPMNFRAEARDAAVHLSWDPPVNKGGLPVTNYTVYRGPMELSFKVVAYVDGTTFEDTNLVNGMTYLYKITAMNELGEGPMTGSISVAPMGLPDPPEDLRITSGLDGIHLEWQPPWETGGVLLTGYIVYRGTDPMAMERVSQLPDTVEELTDGNVTVGRTYYYSVSTLTMVGEGPSSAIVSETAVGPPGPPSNVNAEPGNEQVRITWSPPVDNGSLPIVGYVIMRWTRGEPIDELARLGSVAFYVDNSVENDREYLYYVIALNSIAQGPKGQTVTATPLAPKFAPSEPRDLEIRTHGTKGVLTWNASLYDGGTPVTGYLVMRGSSPDDLETIADVGNIHSFIDPDIEVGVGYFYSVKAMNDAGQGGAHEPQHFIIEQVQDPVDDNEGGIASSVVAISVAAVIAIVGLLAFVLIRRRRTGASRSEGAHDEEPSERKPDEDVPGTGE